VSNAKNRRSRSRERVVACYRKYHISRLCKKGCSGIVSKFWIGRQNCKKCTSLWNLRQRKKQVAFELVRFANALCAPTLADLVDGENLASSWKSHRCRRVLLLPLCGSPTCCAYLLRWATILCIQRVVISSPW